MYRQTMGGPGIGMFGVSVVLCVSKTLVQSHVQTMGGPGIGMFGVSVVVCVSNPGVEPCTDRQ